MKYFIPSLLLLLSYSLAAQPTLHERIWFFGGGHALHFNNNQPIVGGIPNATGYAH